MQVGSAVYIITANKKQLMQALAESERAAQASGRQAGQNFSQGLGAGVGSPNLSSPLRRSLSQVENDMRSSGGRMGSLMQGIFQGIGQNIAGTLTNAIGGAVSAGMNALKGFAGTVYKVGTEAEQLKISFRTIIGDAQKADKLLADMRKFSSATPYTSTDVQKASQKLLTVVKPEDMITTLRRLGDVAAGTKSSLGDLTTIYQQVLSKGKVQAEEMIQFAERGIPIQEAMAKVLGVTKAELIELQGKGKVTSDVMVKAFADMADKGGKFNGIMEKQSKTLAGLASTMQDNFEQAAGLVYTKVNPALVAMLNSFSQAGAVAAKNNGLLELTGQISAKIAEWFKTHQQLVDKVFVSVVKLVESGLREALGVCKGVYTWLQKNPEVVSAINKQVKLWGSGIKVVWDLAKSLAPLFGEVVKVAAKILDVFNAIGEKVQQLTGQLVELINKANEVVGGAVNAFNSSNGQGGSGGIYDNGIAGGKYTIDGRTDQTEKSRPHHDYQRSKDGSGRLVKDLTIGQNGNSSVPVPSPISGTVKVAGNLGDGYGNKVILISPDKKTEVLLGHMASLMVKAGQVVSRGEHLGIQGSTGNSTGTHLHMEAPDAVTAAYYRSLQSGDWGQGNRRTNTPSSSAGKLNPSDQNLLGFAQIIAAGETSGGRNPSVTSGNKGYFQNNDGDIRGWRKKYGNRFGGDISNTGSFESQLNAVKAGLLERGALSDVYSGNYARAIRKTNSFWVSLPGGSQESQVWKNKYKVNEFFPGQPRYNPNFNPDQKQYGAGGASDSELKRQQDSSQPRSLVDMEKSATTQGRDLKADLAKIAAEKAKKLREKAESEAKKRKQAADKIKKDSEEREKTIREAEKSVTDSDLERLDAIAKASGSKELQATVDIRRIQVELQRNIQNTEVQKKAGELSSPQAAKIITNFKATAEAKIAGIRKASVKDIADERKQRAAILTDAQQAVAQSDIDRLDAIADATSDLPLKAKTAIQRESLELQKKLAGIRSKVADGSLTKTQGIDIEKNYRAESAARVKEINNRLAKDQAEELKRQTEEKKRKAEEAKAEADRKAQNEIEAVNTLGNQDVEILRLRASLTSDLAAALEAELASLQNEYNQALTGVDQAVKRGDLTKDRAESQRANLKETLALKQQQAQRDFAAKSAEMENEARRVQVEKGKKIQDAIAASRQAGYDRQDTTVGVAVSMANSDLELARAQGEKIKDPEKARKNNIDLGKRQIGIELTQNLQSIEQLGRSGNYSNEQLDKLRQNAEALSTIKMENLNEQFLTLGQTIQRDLVGSFGTFLHSVITGSSTAGEALANMFSSIAGNLATMGINRLLGGLLGGGGGIQAFAFGGETKGGGRQFNSISDAMKYERGASGRKPVLAVLHEGEIVIPAREAIPGIEGVRSYANGTGWSANFSPRASSININLGDMNVNAGGGISNQDADRLKDMVKNSIYGVLMQETRQGGMFNKR